LTVANTVLSHNIQAFGGFHCEMVDFYHCCKS
jgi:hypothetical protein